MFLSCEQVHEEYKDLLVLMAYKAHLVLLEQLLLLTDSLWLGTARPGIHHYVHREHQEYMMDSLFYMCKEMREHMAKI